MSEFIEKIMQKTVGEKPSKKAFYDCLYMDTNEGSWEYAEKRIKDLLQNQIMEKVILGFDIICKKEQEEIAIETARRIFLFIEESYPNIYAKAVGVTSSEDNRPVREIMTLNHEKIKKFIDSERYSKEIYTLFEKTSDFYSHSKIDLSEKDPTKTPALAYARELKEVPSHFVPKQYKEKFAGLIQTCEKAKAENIKAIFIAFPEVLGDSYHEVIQSLYNISKSGASLFIAPKEM